MQWRWRNQGVEPSRAALPPDVVAPAVDADERLIHVSGVARPGPPTAVLLGAVPAELQASMPSALAGHGHAPPAQQRLGIAAVKSNTRRSRSACATISAGKRCPRRRSGGAPGLPGSPAPSLPPGGPDMTMPSGFAGESDRGYAAGPITRAHASIAPLMSPGPRNRSSLPAGTASRRGSSRRSGTGRPATWSPSAASPRRGRGPSPRGRSAGCAGCSACRR